MFWMLAQGAAAGIKARLENDERRKALRAENAATRATNSRIIANTGEEISAINVQNGLLRVGAARDLNAASREAYAATGSAVANAAAAQVKGASVDAVLNDIDRELGEARVSTEQALELGQYNITNRIREVTSSAAASILGEIDPNRGATSPLMSGLMAAGSTYLSSAMKFGGGGSWFGGSLLGGGSAGVTPSAAQSFGAGDTAAGLTFGN